MFFVHYLLHIIAIYIIQFIRIYYLIQEIH